MSFCVFDFSDTFDFKIIDSGVTSATAIRVYLKISWKTPIVIKV